MHPTPILATFSSISGRLKDISHRTVPENVFIRIMVAVLCYLIAAVLCYLSTRIFRTCPSKNNFKNNSVSDFKTLIANKLHSVWQIGSTI